MSVTGPSSETLVDEEFHYAGASRRAGEKIGRYVVLERVGQGGMGVVYCAFDPELNRKVALKLLRVTSEGASRGSVGASRLMREAQAMARVSHPNVISVHDVGEFEDSIFVAMEFVDGVTLADWLKAKSRGWEEIVAAFRQAGRGLQAAHENGLVHRDFKPENVMMGDDGRVRVLDFGLARPLGGTDVATTLPGGTSTDELSESNALSAPLTRAGAILGTPLYMSPEQHLGENVDARSDQFSFCVALYTALYESHPFRATSLMQLAAKVMAGEVSEPPTGTSEPARVRAAVLRGLSTEASDRWPSMRDLVDALEPEPEPRRTGAGRVAVFGVGLAGALALALAGKGADEQPCRGAAKQLDGVWDQTRRQEVHDALVGIEVAYAGETWTRVEQGLDTYAERWQAAHVDACEATRVRGEQSSLMMDARMRCLAGRRAALGAVVQALTQADASVLEKAVSSVSELPGIEPCSDPEFISAAIPPPDDEGIRVQVEEVRAELAHAKALQDTGQFAEGLALAAEEAEQATALDYLPLQAEAELRLGALREASGEYAEAEQALRAAFFDGRRTGHDEVTARAGVRLVALVGERLKEKERALAWGDHARAEIDRQPSAKLEADLLNNLGAVHYASGEFDRAAELYEQSLEQRRAVLGDEHPEVAASLDNLGRVLYRQGEYGRALEAHEQALRVEEAALGEGHPAVASTLTSMANVLYRQKKLDEALAFYERALGIREKALGRDHAGIAVSLNNIANVYDAKRDYETALKHYLRAVDILERALGPEHPDVASALANVANCHEAMGQLDQALELHTRALELKRKALGADHHSVGYSHHGLGIVRYKRGEYALALEEYRRALAVWEGRLGSEHLLLAYALQGIGKSLIALGRAQEAIELAQRAKDLREQKDAPAEDVAEPTFLLARALWASRSDRERADALAREALAAFEAVEDEDHAAEVREWLETR